MDQPYTPGIGVDLKKISSDFCQLGEDYVFSHITSPTSELLREFKIRNPINVDGLTIFFTIEGELTVEINTNKYKLTPKSVVGVGVSSMARIVSIDSSQINAYCLYLSTAFLKDINIDLNVLNPGFMEQDPSPLTDGLTDDESKQLMGYMHLLFMNAQCNGETIYSKNIARSLTQALLYQLMQIRYSHSSRINVEGKTINRQLSYVKDFMALVQQYHATERSLSFYADKLFISPKYLSRILKDTTGRSAAHWIDQFVLIDAKNMLRFSNKNVQQVAYALNFSTQSSFGKFFKHLTGMSPSEYQQT